MKGKKAFRLRFVSSLAFALAALSVGAPAVAQLAPGAAASANEAPGSPLTGPSGMNATVGVQTGSPAADSSATPGEQRSMAFTAGGGQCRDTVPGGTLLALAYGAVLTLLGVYTVLLAVKNVKLANAVRELEREVLKRAPADKREGDAAS